MATHRGAGAQSAARRALPRGGVRRQFNILDGIVGSILETKPSPALTSAKGKGWATSPGAVEHFAFLESYFSNFIEGTEFEVNEARAFVLDSKPIDARPKDSHDILGVFRQSLQPAWALQTLALGEAVLEQLKARHADQMRERPEVEPGHFKDRANMAGEGEPALFVEAMDKMQAWTAAFRYDDLDHAIAAMQACNAFERSRNQFKLLFPAMA